MDSRQVNTTMLWSFNDIFTHKTNKGVISSWSAASYWGFSPKIDSKIYITYPKGYNPNFKSSNIVKKQRTGIKYSDDIQEITFDTKKMNVYSPERTIVEIIKDAKGEFNDVLVEIIKNFIKLIKYEFSNVIKWAKEFHIEGITKAFFVMGMNEKTALTIIK